VLPPTGGQVLGVDRADHRLHPLAVGVRVVVVDGVRVVAAVEERRIGSWP
jgi:hypothetical protein